MIKPWFALIGIIGIASFGYGQKNVNTLLAGELKGYPENKKAKLVAKQHKSSYTFQLTENTLTVINTNTLDLIALEGNLDHREYVAYNNNVAVLDASVRYTTGKNIFSAKVCGNYEVDDIFYSDAKICSYPMNFLSEGTEITFQSKLQYNDPKYLTRIFFHDSKPTEFREVSVIVPDGVEVELVEKNFDGLTIEKSKLNQAGNTVHTYRVKRLPEKKNEENSLGSLYHFPHLVVLTKSFKTKAGVSKVLASVGDLYNWYASLTKQINNDPSALKAEVERLTKSCKTPEEKIKAIYYWIQDNIKYIAFEEGIAGFRPEAAQQVYQNRFGDCKGMANLTKEMLKLAELDARLTWIGTRQIPYTYDIPSLSVDNHMVCTVFLNNQYFVLDATEKFMPFGSSNAERIQGKQILVENGKDFILKTLPEESATSNQVTRTENLTFQEGALIGQGELSMKGEAKKSFLYANAAVKTEDLKRLFHELALPNRLNTDKIEITNKPITHRDSALLVQYAYTVNNKASKFKDDWYINLDWIKQMFDLSLEEDRVTDYYFYRKLKSVTRKKIQVPEGYQVTHIPTNITRSHPDFSFEVKFKMQGNELVYENIITIPQGLIKKSSFKDWNASIKELKAVYNDPIILSKKP